MELINRSARAPLTRLAASARIAETPAYLLISLGELLKRSGGDATPFLLSVQRQYPDDFWVNYFLGYDALIRGEGPEALRNFQAALATRPDSAFLHDSLGQAFHEAAVALGLESLHEPQLWPDYAPAYYAAFVRDPDGNNIEAVTHSRG